MIGQPAVEAAGLTGRQARQRASELLEAFALAPAAGRQDLWRVIVSDAKFELLDLRDHPLPHLDEPFLMRPATGSGQPHIRIWASLVASEYGYATSGVLKNALDHLYAEWNNKAVGFASHGSADGARAIQHLRAGHAPEPGRRLEHRASRHVVVAGASSGIGRAIALRLAREGHHVFATVRREAGGEALASAAQGRLTPALMDVADAAQIAAVAGQVSAHVGPAGLTALVNNAGVGTPCGWNWLHGASA